MQMNSYLPISEFQSLIPINVRGLRTKLAKISSSLMDSDVDIIGMTETWLDSDILTKCVFRPTQLSNFLT